MDRGLSGALYDLHVPRYLRGPSDVNQYLQNEGWDKLFCLPTRKWFCPAYECFWAGVYHRSAIVIAIETEKGTVIISDCFFKYGNIESWARIRKKAMSCSTQSEPNRRYLGEMESMIEADARMENVSLGAARLKRLKTSP